MDVQFTIVTNLEGRLTKHASLNDGKLDYSGFTNLRKGKFETTSIAWEAFGNIVNKLTKDQALTLGTCCQANSGEIRPKKFYKNNQHSRGLDSFARTKENFTWPDQNRLVFLDIDKISDQDMSPEDLFSEVLSDLPELAKIPSGFWLVPSSSAYLFNTADNCPVSGLAGLHAYFLLPAEYSITELKQYIEDSYWEANEKSFIEVSDGLKPSKLKRIPVDLSVFDPCRLSYASGTDCSGDVEQRRPAPLFIKSLAPELPLDFSNVDAVLAKDNVYKALNAPEIELKVEQKREKAIKTAASEGRMSEAAARRASDLAHDYGIVPASWPIYTDKHGVVKGWELYMSDKWHKVTCRDPYHPDYQNAAPCKAQIYNDRDVVTMNSFAHGHSVYKVVIDYQSVKEIMDKYSESELEAKGFDWGKAIATGLGNEGISKTELVKITKKIKEKYNYDAAEVKEIISSAGKETSKDLLKEALTALNDKWAIIHYSNKIKFITEKIDPDSNNHEYSFMAKEDFLLAEANNRVFSVENGKIKAVKVPNVWIEWPDRREYRGVTFRPDSVETDIDGFVNLYRGLAVGRKTTRTCKKRHCKGKGCFSYFTASFKPCSYDGSNWTRYLDHIYQNVCDKDKKHTLWVIDWIVETIQRRNQTHRNKPGTSLVLRGLPGCGKGTVFAPIMSVLAGYTHHSSSMDEITDKFNKFMHNCMFLFADEATWGGGHKQSSRLKAMMTEDRISLQPKGVDSLMVNNHLRVGISSNSDWVVPAEKGERRYCIFDVSGAKARDSVYFKACVADNDIGNFLDEVLSWQVTSDLRIICETSALVQQQSYQDEAPHVEFIVECVETEWFWHKYADGHISVDMFKNQAQSLGYKVNKGFMIRCYRVLREAGVRSPAKTKLTLPNGKQIASIDIGSKRNIVKALENLQYL